MPFPPPSDPKKPGEINPNSWKWMALAMLLAATAIGLTSANNGYQMARAKAGSSWKPQALAGKSVAGALVDSDGHSLRVDLSRTAGADPVRSADLPSGESAALEPKPGAEASLAGIAVGVAMVSGMAADDPASPAPPPAEGEAPSNIYSYEHDAVLAEGSDPTGLGVFLVAGRPGVFDLAEVEVIDSRGIPLRPDSRESSMNGQALRLGFHSAKPSDVAFIEVKTPKKGRSPGKTTP